MTKVIVVVLSHWLGVDYHKIATGSHETPLQGIRWSDVIVLSLSSDDPDCTVLHALNKAIRIREETYKTFMQLLILLSFTK